MTRQHFLRRLLRISVWSCGLALVGWPVLRFVTWREARTRTVVFAAGEQTPFAAKDGVILVPAGETLQALSARCTHLGCLVHYHDLRKELVCPCHKSAYSLQGKRIRGPAASDLEVLQAEKLENGGLAIALPIRG